MRKTLICTLLMFCAITFSVSQNNSKIRETNAKQDQQVISILKEMTALQSQITSAQNSQTKAEAWLNLNRKADALAVRMTDLLRETRDSGPLVPTDDLNRVADKSAALGISVNYCEIGTDWAANFIGYENYFKLWPDGPNADEAYWKSKVEANACGDFEGTLEEYQQGIERCSDFIKRFPNSSYTERAKSQLEAYQAGLREEQKRQANPANAHN